MVVATPIFVSNGGTTLADVQMALHEMRQGKDPGKNIPTLFTNLVFYPFFSLQAVGTTLEELHDFHTHYREDLDPPWDPSYAKGTFQDAQNALAACRAGLLSLERYGLIVEKISDRDGFDGPIAPPEKLGTTWDEVHGFDRLLALRKAHEVLVRARLGDRTMFRGYFEHIIKDAMDKGHSLECMGTNQTEISLLAAQLR